MAEIKSQRNARVTTNNKSEKHQVRQNRTAVKKMDSSTFSDVERPSSPHPSPPAAGGEGEICLGVGTQGGSRFARLPWAIILLPLRGAVVVFDASYIPLAA